MKLETLQTPEGYPRPAGHVLWMGKTAGCIGLSLTLCKWYLAHKILFWRLPLDGKKGNFSQSHHTPLFVCFQAYVRHPEVASAKANRDFVMKQMSEAVNAISGATQATGTSGPHPLEAPGALATALDDFDVS